ncbi:hypothetical protein B0T19DRAFT_444770 [Cercophora scortea]|uniref:Zn(2)-C6 fungal-type domain-containing protein n=1 Tax=Cercophora scortea TaxID=314031 RepID=A0AAE0M683_9PEZI|nr:hypothetical protein B0T19DRAFT_444770 [Cercophora scortea]
MLPLQPEKKAYHHKRPHRKSRAGCRNCKTRKASFDAAPAMVKCDEARPACRACSMRRESCIYPTTTSASSASTASPAVSLAYRGHAAPSSSPDSRPAPVPVPVPGPGPGSGSGYHYAPASPPLTLSASHSPESLSDGQVVNYERPGAIKLQIVREPLYVPSGRSEADMKLLYLYTTTTYKSFSTYKSLSPDRPMGYQIDYALRVKTVEHAFSSPFLMDCILGLSAMHMDHLGHRDVNVPATRAHAYRARAFQGYRKAIEDADPATFPALLVCSLLLCPLASQMFRGEDARKLYVIDWIIVWRGISLIMSMIELPLLETSGIGPLFCRPLVNMKDAALHIPSNLLNMIASIKEGEIDHPEVEVYHESLRYLGSIYHELLTKGFNPLLNLRIITFFTFLPPRFIQLAQNRRPYALVIIAHHLVFTKIIKTVWWVENVGDKGIQDISEFLGPKWDFYLRVPKAAIHINGIRGIAKLLLDDPTWQPPSPTVAPKKGGLCAPPPNTIVGADGKTYVLTP